MKEQISALIDEELSLGEAEHLYTAMKSGGEAADCWQTYHLIGDVMRGTPTFKANFRSNLMAQLDSEPVVLAPHTRKRPEIKAVWSVAASVSAVMFVGWMALHAQVDAPQQAVNVAQVATPVPAQNVASNDISSVPSEYLAVHQTYAPSNTAYYIQPAAYTSQGNH